MNLLSFYVMACEFFSLESVSCVRTQDQPIYFSAFFSFRYSALPMLKSFTFPTTNAAFNVQ